MNTCGYSGKPRETLGILLNDYVCSQTSVCVLVHACVRWRTEQRVSLPLHRGVVLVYEVRGQGEELLFCSDLIWFALVGHHDGAKAHGLGADGYLKAESG